MINVVIILTGLVLSIVTGFFGLVRLRFAVGLVLACMALNLFGCSTVHAEESPASLWDKIIDCRNGGVDVKRGMCVKASCPDGQYLQSNGTCEVPFPYLAHQVQPQLEYTEPSDWIMFSAGEMLTWGLFVWILGCLFGFGMGIAIALRRRAS